jgi:hypothetical protein
MQMGRLKREKELKFVLKIFWREFWRYVGYHDAEARSLASRILAVFNRIVTADLAHSVQVYSTGSLCRRNTMLALMLFKLFYL